MDIEHKELTLTVGDHQVKAYSAHPADRPAAPGVVVIHEIWGVDPHIRSVTDRLAEAGYAAIAPDVLGMEVTLSHEVLMSGFKAIQTIPPEQRAVPERIQEALTVVVPEHRDQFARLMGAAMKSTSPAGLAIIRAAVDYLKAHGAGKVAVMGFCLGGRATWAYAYSGGVADAFAPFYGALPERTDPALVQGPIEGHFGSEDQGIPIPPLEEAAHALRQQGKHAVIHVYEGAPHAFFNDSRDTFRPQSAQLAWERLLGFFVRTLGAH